MLPDVAVTEAAVQVVARALGVAMVMPAGSVSVRIDESVAAVALLLPSVSVRVEVAPEVIEVGAKALASVGAAALTVSVALAALALLPSLVASAPAARVLVAVPGVLEVTETAIVQPPAGIGAPLAYTTEVLPGVAVTEAAVQVVDRPFGDATVMPAGSASVSAEERAAAVALLLPSVSVRVEVPPEVMVVGLKALVRLGAAALIVSAAEAALALLP